MSHPDDQATDRSSDRPATHTRLDPAHPARREARSIGGRGSETVSQASGSKSATIDRGRSAGDLANVESPLDADAAFDEMQPIDNGSADAVDAELTLQRRLRQASQLAQHLRSRQDELDRRESELNARAAAIENDERLTRLWVEEKVVSINEARSQILNDFDALTAEREAFEQRQQERLDEIAERETNVQAESALLSDRFESFRAERRAFADITRQVQWEHDGALRRVHAAEALAQKQQAQLLQQQSRVESLRFQLEHALRQLRSDSVEMLQARRSLRQRAVESQQELDLQERQCRKRWKAMEKELTRRHEHLENRERGVATRYEETQRERAILMEDEIGLQQMWARVCPPSERAMATRRIAFLRVQLRDLLADQLRGLTDAAKESADQMHTIQAQQAQLEKRKRQIAQWIDQQSSAVKSQWEALGRESKRMRIQEVELERRRLRMAADEAQAAKKGTGVFLGD